MVKKGFKSASLESAKRTLSIINAAGAQLDAFKMVRLSDFDAASGNVKVNAMATFVDIPLGIPLANIADGATAQIHTQGPFTSNLDTSLSTVGNDVYITSTGVLTLSPSYLRVGKVLTLHATAGVIFLDLERYRTMLWTQITNTPTTLAGYGITDGLSSIPQEYTYYVSKVTGSDTNNGQIDTPFATIQKALDTIPVATTGDPNRIVYKIIVHMGTYDEDLSINIAKKKVMLLTFGTVNLGVFNGSNWAPSGVAAGRNITVTCDASSLESIRPFFGIQSMTPGQEAGTHQAYQHNFRMSGSLIISQTASVSGEFELKSVSIFGYDGTTIGANPSINSTGWGGNLNMYIDSSRLYGAITGTSVRLQRFTNSRADAAMSLATYGQISNSTIAAGMTWTTAAAEVPPLGVFHSVVTGTFTGGAGQVLYVDAVTNYHFNANACTLGGTTVKTVLESFDDILVKGQATTPSNPAAGSYKLFVGTDGKFKKVDSSGNVETIGELTTTFTGSVAPSTTDYVIDSMPLTSGDAIHSFVKFANGTTDLLSTHLDGLHDGTDVLESDMYGTLIKGTADADLSFTIAVNGANLETRVTNASATKTYTFKGVRDNI